MLADYYNLGFALILNMNTLVEYEHYILLVPELRSKNELYNLQVAMKGSTLDDRGLQADLSRVERL